MFVRTVAAPAILLRLYSIILSAIMITYDCERRFRDDNSVLEGSMKVKLNVQRPI